MADLPGGTVTFLFTDVEGSAHLWEQYPAAMRLATARHDALVEAVVGSSGGVVVRPRGEGDSRFAVFARATDAVTAAAALQQALTAESWPTPTPLRVRLALHTGEADLRAGDYYGTAVNRCARLRAIAHGGQILISQTTRDLVGPTPLEGVSLRDLGEHRLRDLTASEHVYQLVAPGLPSEFPPLRSLDALPNNLPRQLTSFVGREREIATVQRLLGSSPLVTLTGPGGSGKTRLALRVAADVAEQYRDGVWLVELAPLADALLVPKVVAEALAVPEQPGRGLRDSLADALRPKQLLLVLDNCEHLVQACAELVAALLRASPDLRVLATSRQSLHVDGETTWRVPSLTIPPVESLPSAEALTRHDAPRLFLERASAALPGFAVSDQNVPAIVRICARLDGIPLAIELAAARIRALGLDQIDARLGDRFRILTGGNRTALPRQQTLRATLDWSFGLLSEPERTLFRRLAVFAGGWTLEAAEAVGAGYGLAGDDVLDLLAELVDKSLVIADNTGGTVRYHLLETMREYGWEKLRAAGEETAVRDRHRDWYVTLADEGEPHLHGGEQAVWLTRLEREHDNLRAALAWCLDSERDPASGLCVAGALAWFWRLRGHMTEGRRWLDAALGAPAAGSGASRLRALNGNGLLAQAQGDRGVAAALHEEGLTLGSQLGDEDGIAWALVGLMRIAYARAHWDRTIALAEQSLVHFAKARDVGGSVYPLYVLADVATERGNTERAIALCQEGAARARQVGDAWGGARVLFGWGNLVSIQKDYDQAAVVYREGLALGASISAKWVIALCLRGLVGVLGAQGKSQRAARLYGVEQALRAELGLAPQRHASAYGQGVAAARAALGEERFKTLAADGAGMSLDEMVAYALSTDDAKGPPAGDTQLISPPSPAMPLSPREREVAVLIARGLSNRAIAKALTITPRTADTHVMNILTKLELHSRAQVAAWTAERGLLVTTERH
jgi:predicted ATPase/class 3 adenylate cyclase/DNA-binding CsgD family transcriptional regulator